MSSRWLAKHRLSRIEVAYCAISMTGERLRGS
jgi:hypothetical protein